MSATLIFAEINGASGSHVNTDDISNINFGSTDAANITVADHKIKVGENSFCKYVIPCFIGSFTSVDNIKCHKSAGDYVTDELIKFDGDVAYATPSASDTGDANIPTSEPASNVTGDAAVPFSASIGRYQLQAGGTAPIGVVNQKTITYTWDES